MKRGIVVGIVVVFLILILSGSSQDDVIDSGSPNPFINKLPANIGYWFNLINGALVELYGTGIEGATLNDSALICAIAWQESSFIPAVIDGTIKGGVGEIGLCQIKPSTGLALGFTLQELTDPRRNAQCAFALVREIRARNDLDVENYLYIESEIAVVLGGYNGGIAAEKNPSIVSRYVNDVYDRYEAISINQGLIVLINP